MVNGLVYVALGGALGASCRYLVSWGAVNFLSSSTLWATLFVNVLGSFALGILVGTGPSIMMSTRLLWAVGFLGSFTTFSAFSLEMVMMVERGDWMGCLFYILGSVMLSFLAMMGAMLWVR